MKRVFFVLVVFFAMATASAQEQGLHLTIEGGVGWTNFAHDLKGGGYKGRTGYGIGIGAQYFFNRHVGISLGADFFQFNTQSRYNKENPVFSFTGQRDDEGDPYDLHIRLENWKENQKTNFIEIPLMLVFQHKFGKSETYGWYFGVGVKPQFSVSSSFKRYDGKVKMWAYYPEWDLILGQEVEIPWHAYGSNISRKWDGTNSLKMGFAAVGEFGFLFGISRRVDFTLGVSVDYGLIDISKLSGELLGPKAGIIQQEGSFVAEQIVYNGIINSNRTYQVTPWSLRGEIGLRVKIGKLRERDEDKDENDSTRRSPRTPVIDTIFVYPIIKYLQPNDQDDDGTDGAGGAGTRSGGSGGNGQGGLRSPSARAYSEPLPEGIEEELLEPIYFDLDKYTLSAKSKEILDRKVALMKKYPQAVLAVVGHTCDIGSELHNDKLSYDRADAARYYLIEKGVNPARILPIARGKKDPTYPNVSEINRELNRRVDFILSR